MHEDIGIRRIGEVEIPYYCPLVWRQTLTTGEAEEVYLAGDGTADVITVVIPPQEPVYTDPIVRD